MTGTDDLAATYDDELGRARCTAVSKRSGDRCRNYPITGSMVCRMHGGAARQVRQSARMRLAALVDPAIDVLAESLTLDDKHSATRLRAVEAVLSRAGYPARTELDLQDGRERLAERVAALQAEQ